MAKSSDLFKTALKTPMSAKRLVLGLFGALDDKTLPISKLILGADVFDIEEPAVRMAVNRLVNEGVLALIERGAYGIGEQGVTLHEASRAWQRQEDRLQDWTGEWVCVHVSHLGRSDRKVLKSRLRAFALCGFSELEDGLWIRPSNLALTTSAIADELVALGLDEGAVVLRVAELVHQRAEDVAKLWDRKSLEASYQSALVAMEKSKASIPSKALEDAAREVHEIGSSVVSILTHDPLLPPSFVHVSLRRRVYEAMLAYDKLGKSIWMELFDEDENPGRSNVEAR